MYRLLVLDFLEFMEAEPSVVVLMKLQIVVEGADDCLGALVHVKPDD